MKILVTGAGGFIGQNLTRALMRRSFTKIVLTDQAPCPSSGRHVVVLTGDFGDPFLLADAFSAGIDLVYHLAAVPGGLAERDPALSRRVNRDATLALMDHCAAARARFVNASTIAVLGTPTDPVADDTVPHPDLVYGKHKLETETVLSRMARAGEIVGMSIRLPGIVARPPVEAGLKSAFLSDLFHALREDRTFTCPMSADATIWLMSVQCCVENIIHAGHLDPSMLDEEAVTLPALRVKMSELVATVSTACGASPDRVTYAPDAALEKVFGRLPPLSTKRANKLGFRHDGDLRQLVETVLADLSAAIPETR